MLHSSLSSLDRYDAVIMYNSYRENGLLLWREFCAKHAIRTREKEDTAELVVDGHHFEISFSYIFDIDRDLSLGIVVWFFMPNEDGIGIYRMINSKEMDGIPRVQKKIVMGRGMYWYGFLHVCTVERVSENKK